MPLKKGLMRESCESCYRRKIKCDRSKRLRQGIDKCSSCEARKTICWLDTSKDDRRYHERPISLENHTEVSSHGSEHATAQSRARDCPSSGLGSIELAATNSGHIPVLPTDFSFDDTFSLSSDSRYYLNQVFEDMSSTTNSYNDAYLDLFNEIDSNIYTPKGSSLSDTNNEPRPIRNEEDETWLDKITTPEVLGAAINAYFGLASAALPILLPDAFWSDYKAGKCSLALIQAIACRGMPFTMVYDKWKIQQRFAVAFRESFLMSRVEAIEGIDGFVRLDELEALAIMLDFQYDDDGLKLQKSLQRLFLTHDSLVLLTLRYGKRDSQQLQTQESTLSRYEDRRSLLYWYVFGIDAFHCLDRKQISCIPEIEIAVTRTLPQDEAKDYLDAILGLAIVARKITHALCNSAVKNHGISPTAITHLYKELETWATMHSPKHLQQDCHHQDENITSRIPAGKPQWYHQLHSAVLYALEANCIMQIEACVVFYHLQSSHILDVNRTVLRIRSECLGAINMVLEGCVERKLLEPNTDDPGAILYSQMDLAPSIIRDICVGICCWIYQQINDGCMNLGSFNGIRKYTPQSHQEEERVADYIAIAKQLELAIATAVSHRDTIDTIKRLEQQRVSLALPDVP